MLFLPKSGTIIGIDPGLTGGISFLEIETDGALSLKACFDIPLKSKPVTTKSQREIKAPKKIIDFLSVSLLIDLYRHETIVAFIEEPSAMPGQGVVSMFNFGYTCGALAGVLIGQNIQVIPIKPPVWKFGLGLTADKSEAVKKAKSLFPGNEDVFTYKKDGRAESALIGYYGFKETFKRRPPGYIPLPKSRGRVAFG